MPRITTAYIGLGSNVGDRARHLEDGARLLVERTGARARVSPVYETAPLDYVDQTSFLNAVVELAGELPPPFELLDICLTIEVALGRRREIAKGPRTLDLDLLLYDACVTRDDRLTLPHPRLHERRFVLEPLSDLAPDAMHPTLGRTIRELRDALESSPGQAVTRI